ncbi:hypothetical protein A8C56_10380 [Niabella ginsenosidivorans]|uniref:Uncharacterized protein n=1 Tax=Niabella ginsenosidivorans TaxID=1176587 RepID=A0A1A9I0Z7_9BACT|nr:hypothetical protein A8C56_10380 [Niabella ginsenosidivorans]
MEEQDETVDTYHGYPIVIKRYPSNSLTYAVNFNVQLNNRKHLFLSHDFFPGGSRYLRSGSWSGHFAYRLSVGLRF